VGKEAAAYHAGPRENRPDPTGGPGWASGAGVLLQAVSQGISSSVDLQDARLAPAGRAPVSSTGSTTASCRRSAGRPARTRPCRRRRRGQVRPPG